MRFFSGPVMRTNRGLAVHTKPEEKVKIRCSKLQNPTKSTYVHTSKIANRLVPNLEDYWKDEKL